MARLGDIATYVNGFAFKPTDWSDTGLPIIRIQDLTGNSYQANRYNGKYDSKYEILDGDVLISWSASLGVYVWHGETALLNQHIFKVVFDKVDVDKNFFIHQVKAILEKASSEAHGATMKHLTKPVFDALPFYLPSIEEQRDIAEKLDKVCTLIEQRKQQIEKLDQLVKSRFVELFEKEEYKKVTVSSVLNTGFWLMPATPEFMVDGEVPYITSKNIKNRTIDFDNVKYISREAYKSISANRPTQKGDILISMIGTLGQTAVIQDDREFYGQNLYLLRLNNAIVNITYFCEFFNSDTAQYKLQGKRNQSTQAYLKANHVEDLILPLPPMKLQEQFAAFVEQTDKSKLAVQQSLEKLEILKNSLMQEYFG